MFSRFNLSLTVTLDVPVSKSDEPTEVEAMDSETISDQTIEQNESIASSRTKRGGTKNAAVVGKKSQPPIPSSDEDTGVRQRGKRKGKSKGESPNKKADMANCFGFESDVSV